MTAISKYQLSILHHATIATHALAMLWQMYDYRTRQKSRALMSSHYLPVLSTDGMCKNYDPEWWFPEKVRINSRKRTKEEMLARTICTECPVRTECLDYALGYSGLFGIWGGFNEYERARIQKERGIVPTAMVETLSRFGELHIRKEEILDEE